MFSPTLSRFLEKKRRRHHVALDEESERVLVAVEGEADRHGDERFGFGIRTPLTCTCRANCGPKV